MSEDANSEGNRRQTMADVNHTHPHTGETFGVAFARGPAVADGGVEPTAERGTAGTMADIDHAPPSGEDTNEMWTRGPARAADADPDAAESTDRAVETGVTDE